MNTCNLYYSKVIHMKIENTSLHLYVDIKVYTDIYVNWYIMSHMPG